MKQAYIFPGQGSQFSGMGKALYEPAKEIFEKANEMLGFNITEVMFGGSDEQLKQTDVTQPAIFIHSVAAFSLINDARPDMVAGHSLGEFSALVANQALSFEDALKLVSVRASAMKKACDAKPSAMAAIIGLDDEKVEEICSGLNDEIVVPANFNCPGQLVISGSIEGIDRACELMKAAGAKRALKLPVGGAFHSPFMAPAKEELKAAIHQVVFKVPVCPIYQNVVAEPVTDPEQIKNNLIEQLTGAVRWTQTVRHMIRDGATLFTEVGPGKVLQGLVQKIDKNSEVAGVN